MCVQVTPPSVTRIDFFWRLLCGTTRHKAFTLAALPLFYSWPRTCRKTDSGSLEDLGRRRSCVNEIAEFGPVEAPCYRFCSNENAPFQTNTMLTTSAECSCLCLQHFLTASVQPRQPNPSSSMTRTFRGRPPEHPTGEDGHGLWDLTLVRVALGKRQVRLGQFDVMSSTTRLIVLRHTDNVQDWMDGWMDGF